MDREIDRWDYMKCGPYITLMDGSSPICFVYIRTIEDIHQIQYRYTFLYYLY